MSTTSTQRPPTQNYSGGAVGVIVFAAVLMILEGTMQALQGFVAIVNNELFAVRGDYVFKFDVSAWGWIHLAIGIIVALAGFGLFSGAVWARTVAVVVAMVSIVSNFLWMPYYPIWSLTLVALGVFVIWAVTAHGRDIAAE
jgi:hypothetical protein